MATKCACLHKCPDGAVEGVCHLKPGGICFAHAEAITHANGTVITETTRGCFPPDVEGLLQCKGALSDHTIPKNITCCQDSDFCNNLLSPTIDAHVIQDINHHYQPDPLDWQQITIYALAALVLFSLLSSLVFFIRRRQKGKKSKPKCEIEQCESDDFDKTNYSFGSCKPLLPVPQLLDSNCSKPFSYPIVSHQTLPHLSYLRSANSSASSDSSGSSPYIKYNYLNNSQNGSNSTINHFRYLASTASHTTGSINSEQTQQTTLSSQRVTSSNGSLPPVNESSVSSGSGSGTLHLVQKTLASDIELANTPIGVGRYGEVYHGRRRGEDVAVKIFYSREEASWKREIEIYTTVIMRHENILGFLGADVTSWNGCTQLWLITEYHHLGSLYNFLLERPIRSVPHLLRMMQSIVNGLEHLHNEMIGTLGKPAIAHRDLKSKNILMKRDGTCCIADFGLAVVQAPNSHSIYGPSQSLQTGTKRYMAPEVLAETNNQTDNFGFFRCADLYSLALVFWEMYNRLELNGESSTYSVPFERHVSKDPSIEEMRHVVVTQKMRPQLKDYSNNDHFEILNSIRFLITECWSENPSARPSSLYTKKKLLGIVSR